MVHTYKKNFLRQSNEKLSCFSLTIEVKTEHKNSFKIKGVHFNIGCVSLW